MEITFVISHIPQINDVETEYIPFSLKPEFIFVFLVT